MEASFFKNATNVRIGGRTQFHSVVAGRDVHQVNHLGDTYNTNSNNRTKTVIKDSYNDNSQHIVGSGARNHSLARGSGGDDESSETDSSAWTEDSRTNSSEEEDFEGTSRDNRRPKAPQKKPAVRAPKTRAKRRPAAPDHEVRSAPEVHTAVPPARSTTSAADSDIDSRDRRPGPAPAPAQTVSAPAVPTQATTAPAALSPSESPSARSPYLAVPQTPSSTSVATSTGLTQAAQSLNLNRPASAPVPSAMSMGLGMGLGSSVGSSSVTVPSPQSLSGGAGHVDLSARYRYLVVREETRYEIRRKLVNVAQSAPRDKFFTLKEQATRANKILGLVEGSKEKVLRNKELVQLSLESHAVAFIAIMTAEKQTPDAKRIYNLLKILDDVEELVTDIVHNGGLSKWHPLKRGENKNSVRSYRKKLESWLQEFQNDKDVTIDFALHQAANALSEALYAEQQYAIAIAVHEPSQSVPSTSPASSQMQTPVSSPGSTSLSNMTGSAAALGRGSASVINAEGPGNKRIHQNSHNNNSVNIYR